MQPTRESAARRRSKSTNSLSWPNAKHSCLCNSVCMRRPNLVASAPVTITFPRKSSRSSSVAPKRCSNESKRLRSETNARWKTSVGTSIVLLRGSMYSISRRATSCESIAMFYWSERLVSGKVISHKAWGSR